MHGTMHEQYPYSNYSGKRNVQTVYSIDTDKNSKSPCATDL